MKRAEASDYCMVGSLVGHFAAVKYLSNVVEWECSCAWDPRKAEKMEKSNEKSRLKITQKMKQRINKAKCPEWENEKINLKIMAKWIRNAFSSMKNEANTKKK